MSFYGSSFIYNGIPSEIYDLRIFDFEPANPSTSPAGGDVSIQEKWLYRREKPYFYGRYYESPLEFDFTVGSYSYIDGASRHAIEAWLLGKPYYLPLQIVQGDISDVIFNAILTQSTHHYIGNLNYALTLHARCDRPWGISYPQTVTRVYSASAVPITDTFEYFNGSVYSGYNRPTLTFTTTSGSDVPNLYVSVINNTDSGREFRFDDLGEEETLEVDNDHEIIQTNTENLRMANFNKKFFRLVQGVNSITVSGYLSELSIDTVFARGVGA